MWFAAITLFPEMFTALNTGIVGRALKQQHIQLALFNPRDFTHDKHQTVDAKPYGGGPGMLMMAEPLFQAIEAAKKAAPTPPTVIYLSPQGTLFNQAHTVGLLAKKSLIFLCGRYEGVDERIIKAVVDEEWSLGDYVLTGGELPAMVMMDTLARLLPNVLGDEHSNEEDAITTGLLKYPQYTRPETWQDDTVPPVLLSGHHLEIQKWRLKQSLGRTYLRRPDLLAKKALTPQEKQLLDEFIAEKTQ